MAYDSDYGYDSGDLESIIHDPEISAVVSLYEHSTEEVDGRVQHTFSAPRQVRMLIRPVTPNAFDMIPTGIADNLRYCGFALGRDSVEEDDRVVYDQEKYRLVEPQHHSDDADVFTKYLMVVDNRGGRTESGTTPPSSPEGPDDGTDSNEGEDFIDLGPY